MLRRGDARADVMEAPHVTLEDLTPVRKRLQVEISATDVQAELERAFATVGRQARLRGFRPGRVPRPVLERTFGEQVRREVLGKLVEASLRQAIEAHHLEPVGTPDIDADPLTPGQSLRYAATIDVRRVIEVAIRALRSKELPALDDDFARDHGRCQSLAELRTRVRSDLEREAEARATDTMHEAVLDQLFARHPFDVPPTLVERRVEAQLGTLGVREGADHQHALDELRAELRPRAERQVRAELLLDAVASRLDSTVEESEIEAAIETLAARESHGAERLRALYRRPEAHAALHAKLVRDRALARLVGEDRAGARSVPALARVDIAREK